MIHPLRPGFRPVSPSPAQRPVSGVCPQGIQLRAARFMDQQDALVPAAPELKTDITELLFEFPVHKNIDMAQKFIRHLAVGPPGGIQEVAFIGIACVAPDIFGRRSLLLPGGGPALGSRRALRLLPETLFKLSQKAPWDLPPEGSDR